MEWKEMDKDKFKLEMEHMGNDLKQEYLNRDVQIIAGTKRDSVQRIEGHEQRENELWEGRIKEDKAQDVRIMRSYKTIESHLEREQLIVDEEVGEIGWKDRNRWVPQLALSCALRFYFL